MMRAERRRRNRVSKSMSKSQPVNAVRCRREPISHQKYALPAQDATPVNCMRGAKFEFGTGLHQRRAHCLAQQHETARNEDGSVQQHHANRPNHDQNPRHGHDVVVFFGTIAAD
eukprot:3179999-Prymnesium_polylepis.1